MAYSGRKQSSPLRRPLALKALQALHVVFENIWCIPNLFVNWDRILSLFLNLVSLELKGKILFSKRRILHLFRIKKKKNMCYCHAPSKICLKIWGKIRKHWVGVKVILHSLIINFKLVLNDLLIISENQISIRNRFTPYILLFLVAIPNLNILVETWRISVAKVLKKQNLKVFYSKTLTLVDLWTFIKQCALRRDELNGLICKD